ncbi:hypothetical protein ABEB36_012552 [Hypothenemus hampei]|uniref:Alpha-carbonic anhydrase domain-containing protein n=1 Tax=Hypothenemus hampei TaxID=57062 RepID=A0ABD1EBM2_HYPHA
MMFLEVELFFFILLAGTALGGHWTYNDEEQWSSLCQNGQNQSPIALFKSIATIKHLSPLSMHGYGQRVKALLKNNGHSAEVRLEGVEAPRFHGGGLAETYQLDHLHFHWQSEHTLDGYRLPLELHLVHFSQQYRNLSEAIQHPHGVAVLAVLFDLSADDDEDFQPLLDIIHNLKEKVGEPRQLQEFSAKNFLPRDKGGFYRYSGSLTTPGCNEGVVWTIFSNTLPISNRQVNIFKAIQTEDREPLIKNYRSLQPLNGRTVYLRVSPIRDNGAFAQKFSLILITVCSACFLVFWC